MNPIAKAGRLMLLVLAASTAANALTYVPVADDLLVRQAAVIARGVFGDRIVSAESGRIATSHEFRVEQVFKGSVASSPLVIRVAGGIDLEQGLGVKIFGTPRFEPGQAALLFLAEAPRGAYRVLHVFQGAFAERLSDGVRYYQRPGADRYEASLERELDASGDAIRRLAIRRAEPIPRDADRFERWIEERVKGSNREADYLLQLERPRKTRLSSEFTYLAGDDFILRWFNFDDGGKVRWHRHVDGQEGFADGGAKAFKRARKAWRKKFSGVPIKLTNAGLTTATNGFEPADSKNTLLHSDVNDEIGEDFECPGGGVLAVGGLSDFDFFFTQWKGLSTLRAHEAEIIVNDGIDCFVQGDSDILAQIYAHELGHTLGLGHSCGDSTSPKCRKSETLSEALMAASLAEVFGAKLRDDDVFAARQLYDQEFWSAACEKRVPGAKSFCNKCGPCGEGQGNCKKDVDCFGSLVCTRDIGADYGFAEDVNVCTPAF